MAAAGEQDARGNSHPNCSVVNVTSLWFCCLHDVCRRSRSINDTDIQTETWSVQSRYEVLRSLYPVDGQGPDERPSFDRRKLSGNVLYASWSGHKWTFLAYLVISCIAVTITHFTRSRDEVEEFILSSGGWLGVLACLLYIISLCLPARPHDVKAMAITTTVLSIFAFAADFLIFALIIWAVKNEHNESQGKDYVLEASALVLFFHGCLSVVTFAKSLVIGMYELPPRDFILA